MTPEGRVKQEIKKGLEEYKSRCHVFMPVQTGFGKRSVDFLVCLDGRFIAIEAKRGDGKGKLTTSQKKYLEVVKRAGGISITATSWYDVEFVLAQLQIPGP